MILDGLVRRPARGTPAGPTNAVTLDAVGLTGVVQSGETAAMKLAAVNRCLEVLSDSMGKMPSYAMVRTTRERVYPPVLELLNLRPNEAMTPFIRRKMLEINRLTRGNAYDWVIRDPISMAPVELIPLPAELVSPWQDTTGRVWYDVTHPYNGGRMRLPSEDVLHYKGYTRDGLRCISVLQRAAQVIGAGLSAQEYQGSYYANGGQPSGVLSTEADLGGYRRPKKGCLAERVGENSRWPRQGVQNRNYGPWVDLHPHLRHHGGCQVCGKPRCHGPGYLQLLWGPGL